MSGKMSPKTVEEKLSELISNCRVQDKLPTESELMKEYGVSRSMLREVLKSFEARGIIVSKQGSGRYVQNPDFVAQLSSCWKNLLNAASDQLLELLEIRSILELNTIQTAVNCATPDQLQFLAEQVERMQEKAANGQPFVEEDRKFHTMIFSSTGNRVMADLLNIFWDLFEQSGIDAHHGDLELAANQHARIFEAFAKKDAQTAQNLMAEQFSDMRYLITLYLVQKRKS